jgi:hypothetical protein
LPLDNIQKFGGSAPAATAVVQTNTEKPAEVKTVTKTETTSSVKVYMLFRQKTIIIKYQDSST